jgi:hypothetical protein
MKRALLVSALVWLGLLFMVPPAVVEAVDDPMQRFFRFHNELNDTPIRKIYPVISAKQDTNCAAKYGANLLRIVVHGKAGRGQGVDKDETVIVKIPKTEDGCGEKGLFYNAARFYIFTTSVEQFDAVITPYGGGNLPQTTVPLNPQPPWAADLCFDKNGVKLPDVNGVHPCWVGRSRNVGVDYVTDGPLQLGEFTIISRVGTDGLPNPNDPAGTSNFGYNISYVDHAYLPVALGVAGGEHGFLGTSMAGTTLSQRLTNFVNDAATQWSVLAAWSKAQFEGSQATNPPGPIPPTTAFRGLVKRDDKVPSGDIVLKGTRQTPAISSSTYTYNVWDGETTKACNAIGHPLLNLACKGLAGNCCTQPSPGSGVAETFAGCCDTPNNALIDGLSRDRKNAGAPLQHHNRTLSDLMNRWMKWRDGNPDGYNCNNPVGPLDNPTVGNATVPPTTDLAAKVDFCNRFKRSVNYLFDQFESIPTHNNCVRGSSYEKFATDDQYNQCIVASIVGFDIVPFDKRIPPEPDPCVSNGAQLCPNDDPSKCPAACSNEFQRNFVAQSVLRSVPWTGQGNPVTQCAQCPSTNEAECQHIACISNQVKDTSPLNRQYHFDGFLHFWAPYSGNGSAYNLDPYARFIHNKDIGLDALSAYSFSIDDFYGFVSADGTTLIVNVGGKSALDNRDPRDPYSEFSVTFGSGFHGARVCGREYNFPPTGGRAFPVSFYKLDGGQYIKKQYCEVTVFTNAAKTQWLKALLELKTLQVTDRWTGLTHTVETLSGGLNEEHTWVDRHDNAVVPLDKYCVDNSNDPGKAQKCTLKMFSQPTGAREAYIGVHECASSRDQTCGRPLVQLIFGAN